MKLFIFNRAATLTGAVNIDYSVCKVLETPKQRKAAPDRLCGFFVPVFFLWAGVRGIQYPERGNYSAGCLRFLAPAHPDRNGVLEILQTEVQK